MSTRAMTIRLYHCKVQNLERVARIEPNSVNLILTDIPYGNDSLSQVCDIGEFARRIREQGVLPKPDAN
jgi:site-specific DNA-methyltransferase (adenine-specific)